MNLTKYVDFLLAVFLTVGTIALIFATGLGVMLALGGTTINW